MHQQNRAGPRVREQVQRDLRCAWSAPILWVDIPQHDLLAQFRRERARCGVQRSVGRAQASDWIHRVPDRRTERSVRRFDLRDERLTVDLVERCVVKRVVLRFVALADDPRRQIRIGVHVLAQHEECRRSAVPRKRFEYLRCPGRMRSIVKGEIDDGLASAAVRGWFGQSRGDDRRLAILLRQRRFECLPCRAVNDSRRGQVRLRLQCQHRRSGRLIVYVVVTPRVFEAQLSRPSQPLLQGPHGAPTVACTQCSVCFEECWIGSLQQFLRLGRLSRRADEPLDRAQIRLGSIQELVTCG